MEFDRRARASSASIVIIIGTGTKYAMVLLGLPEPQLRLSGSHPASSAAYVAIPPKALAFALSGFSGNLPPM
jgi:hypothetical protein